MNPSGAPPLELTIEGGPLYISSLSSLLRTLQAALRETAREDEQARAVFQQRPQPVLVAHQIEGGDTVHLDLLFLDPVTRQPLGQLSRLVFQRFLSGLVKFLAQQPQPGLWGMPAHSSPKRGRRPAGFPSRLPQVVAELRRFSAVSLTCLGFGVTTRGTFVNVLGLDQPGEVPRL